MGCHRSTWQPLPNPVPLWGLPSRHAPAEWSGGSVPPACSLPRSRGPRAAGCWGLGLPTGLDIPVTRQWNWSSCRASRRPRRRGSGGRRRSRSGTRSWPWRAGRWPTARTSPGSRGRRSAWSLPRGLLCPQGRWAGDQRWQAGRRTAHSAPGCCVPHRRGAPGCRLTCRGLRPVFAGSSVPSEPSAGPRRADPVWHVLTHTAVRVLGTP